MEQREDAGNELRFAYTNYRGEVSVRRVQILGLRWGSTQWHPHPQWLIRAFDLDKNEEREFAFADMRDLGHAVDPTAPGDGRMAEG